MKSCWIFLAMFALAGPNELKQKLSRVLRDCREAHGIDDVKQLQDWDSPELKEYLFCVFTFMSWMDQSGDLLLTNEEVKDLLPNELSDEEKDETIEKCHSLRDGNSHDTIYKCYWPLCGHLSFCI